MREVISTELKFWKLALRESYHLGLITESDLIRMHSAAFYESLSESMNATDSANVAVVFDVMGDIQLFANLMKDEAQILITGVVPGDKSMFKKMWISYLLDCRSDKYITDEQFDVYYNSIEFDGIKWSKHEREAAHDIIEVIRLMLVHQNSNLMEYIENPSFDLLMYVNNLEYV